MFGQDDDNYVYEQIKNARSSTKELQIAMDEIRQLLQLYKQALQQNDHTAEICKVRIEEKKAELGRFRSKLRTIIPIIPQFIPLDQNHLLDSLFSMVERQYRWPRLFGKVDPEEPLEIVTKYFGQLTLAAIQPIITLFDYLIIGLEKLDQPQENVDSHLDEIYRITDNLSEKAQQHDDLLVRILHAASQRAH